MGAPLADGPHLVTARAVDAAGNAGAAGAPLLLMIDTAAPAAPPAPTLAPPGGGGDAASDATRPLLRLAGAEPGSTVELLDTAFAGGVAVTRSLGFAAYDPASGSWSLRVGAPLADGPHLVTARAVDAAGNAGAAGAPLLLMIDTSVPAPLPTPPAPPGSRRPPVAPVAPPVRPRDAPDAPGHPRRPRAPRDAPRPVTPPVTPPTPPVTPPSPPWRLR